MKQKVAKIDLDDLDLMKKKGVHTKEEVIKMRDVKFGKASKRPSLIARDMADSMFKDLDTGTWINVTSFDESQKKGIIRSFKRDFSTILRAAERKDLKIVIRDQGDKLSFYFSQKKKKDDGVIEEKPKKKTKKK